MPAGGSTMDSQREKAFQDYRKKLMEHKEVESRLKDMREQLKDLTKQYDKSENDLKALQSVGQIVGEVLKQLTEEKFIVKATNGPRYVVGCRRQLDKNKLKGGTRVALDMTTLTIMRHLPREVIELPLMNPELFVRVGITPPKGCLLYGPPGTGKTLLARAVASQLDANFLKVLSWDHFCSLHLYLLPAVRPARHRQDAARARRRLAARRQLPQGTLVGPLLFTPLILAACCTARPAPARRCSRAPSPRSSTPTSSRYSRGTTFVVSSAIVDKYIGESARLIREMFNYARDHQPCIIFMDEIDAIGGRRFSEGTSADREIQRTLMELLNQMDGFDSLGQVKIIMATNRPDTLDPALLRPGRLDRKIEIPLPNEQARRDCHILSLLYSILFNPQTPQYLKDRFVFHSSNSLRDLRSSHNLSLVIPPHTTDFVAKSFYIRAIKLWNSLPDKINIIHRLEILKIHAAPIAKHGEMDYEAVVKLSDTFNGADLRNVCTEAGLFAIRAEREYIIQEDLMKAVRKVADNKKLESKLDYKPV
ncbi:unnamed protein product [Diatraea saccharalis]|uniref:AAA+ ATPase domain-containing protein n=1 Tax=Diatraea saccharalis TaxID=40085 RepID=A0A9N9RC30_9NEOP|nr:unnamed protein product [Diatraea saccharalis]